MQLLTQFIALIWSVTESHVFWDKCPYTSYSVKLWFCALHSFNCFLNYCMGWNVIEWLKVSTACIYFDCFVSHVKALVWWFGGKLVTLRVEAAWEQPGEWHFKDQGKEDKNVLSYPIQPCIFTQTNHKQRSELLSAEVNYMVKRETELQNDHMNLKTKVCLTVRIQKQTFVAYII